MPVARAVAQRLDAGKVCLRDAEIGRVAERCDGKVGVGETAQAVARRLFGDDLIGERRCGVVPAQA